MLGVGLVRFPIINERAAENVFAFSGRKDKMNKILSLVLLILLTLSACSYASPETSLSETAGHTLNLNGVIGGRPDNLITVCDVADLEGIDVTYVSPGDIAARLEDPKFYAKLQEHLRAMSSAADHYRLNGASGCFISRTEVAAFRISDCSCATTFNCYLFTSNMEPAGEIMFFVGNGELTFNSVILYQSGDNSTPYSLNVMQDAPDKKHILLTNDYDDMLLDEQNKIYAKNAAPFSVVGDYFHALDWEAIAVSYSEITADDNLLWISFD